MKKYWLLVLLFIGTCLRLVIIGSVGLGDDEAHYWSYSQHLDLSYYDHPPMIGYLIKFSTALLGNTEFAIRIIAVIFFLVVASIMFLLTKKIFDDTTAFFTVVLLNITPVFFIGSVYVTPDVPLCLFWVGAIYISYLIVISERKNYWYILGIFWGLALLSKYNAVFLPLSFFLFLMCSREYRFWFRCKEPYISILIAGIIFLPVLIWNFIYKSASFRYQLSHGLGQKFSFDIHLLLRNLVAQAGYLSPLLFFACIISLIYLTVQVFRKSDSRFILLWAYSFPVIIFFTLIGCFNEILPHWPALGYLPLLIFVPYWYNKSIQIAHKSKKNILNSIFVLLLLIDLLFTAIIPLQVIYKIIPVPRNLPERVDITNELYGWREVSKKISSLLSKDSFVLTHRHYLANQIAFYLKYLNSPAKVYCLNEYTDQYDFWQDTFEELNNRDAVFVTDDRFPIEVEKVYPFKNFLTKEEINIYRRGKIVRTFYITKCINLDTKLLPKNFVGRKLNLDLWNWFKILDRNIFISINHISENKIMDYFMLSMSLLGDGFFLVPIIAILLLIYNRKEFKNNLLFFVSILLLSGIVVQVLKAIFNRPRPLKEFSDTNIHVKVLLSPLYEKSFPSGHSQAIFVAATYLLKKIKKYSSLILLVAILVGLSRVYIGAHFVSDVIGGAIIGIVITQLFFKLSAKYQKVSKEYE